MWTAVLLHDGRQRGDCYGDNCAVVGSTFTIHYSTFPSPSLSLSPLPSFYLETPAGSSDGRSEDIAGSIPNVVPILSQQRGFNQGCRRRPGLQGRVEDCGESCSQLVLEVGKSIVPGRVG